MLMGLLELKQEQQALMRMLSNERGEFLLSFLGQVGVNLSNDIEGAAIREVSYDAQIRHGYGKDPP